MTFKKGDRVQFVGKEKIELHPNAQYGEVLDVYPELPNIVKVNFDNVGPLMTYVSKLEKQEDKFVAKYPVGTRLRILFGDYYRECVNVDFISIQYGKWGYGISNKTGTVGSWVSANYLEGPNRVEVIVLPEVVDALDSLQYSDARLCGARARTQIDVAKTALNKAIQFEEERLADIAAASVR